MQSTTKTIAKNFSFLFLGNGISGAINVLTAIYIARVLGAATFGVFQFAIAFLIYLAIIVDSGMSMFGIREVASNKFKAGSIVLNIFVVRFIASVLIYAIAALIIVLLPTTIYFRTIFLLVFLQIFYRALNPEWVFQGLERTEFNALFRILCSASTFALIFIFVPNEQHLLRIPLIQFSAGIIFTIFILIFLFTKILSVNIKMFNPRGWFSLFIIAFPLGASALLTQIYSNLDVIMLGFISKPEIVGFYSAAYQIFNVLLAAFFVWQATAIPTATRRILEDKEKAKVFLEKYIRLTMLAIIPAVVLIYLFSPIIIALCFGEGYFPAAGVLQWLIWTMLPLVIGSTLGLLVLISAGKYGYYFWAGAAGATINFILNMLLIPQYNMYGAAFATIVAECLACLVAFYFARKVLRLNLLSNMLAPLCVGCLALLINVFVVVYGVGYGQNICAFISGSIFVAIYLIFLLVFERKLLVSLAREILSRFLVRQNVIEV
ncbi:MAG: flippase [Candidatus Margulisiibacteriota bacterium]